MHKWLKITLTIFGVLLLITLLSGFFLPDILEKKLSEALVGEFSEQTKGQYSLTLSDLEVSLFKRSVQADSIVVRSEVEGESIRSVKSSSVRIDGIKWLNLIKQRFPEFKSVTITEPDVEILSRRITGPPSRQETQNDITLSVFDVYIKDGKGKIVEDNGMTVFSLDAFDLSARDVDLNSLLAGSNVPYLRELSVTAEEIFWNLEKDLYRFTIDKFAFDKVSEMVSIRNLALTPVVEKYRFAKIKGQQVDRFDLNIASIEIDGLDLDSLDVPSIDVDRINIGKADLEVFHDKHMPSGQGIRYKPLLHDALKAVGFSLGVDSILITDSKISYGEHLPNSKDPGFISFDRLDAELRNIRTPEHRLYSQDSLYMDADTYFMDESLLEVDMSYAVYEESDFHNLKARLGSMPASVLNPMLVNVAFMKIDDGLLNSMYLDLDITNRVAEGAITLDYEDLKITMLDENDNTNTNLKTRLRSLIANKFVMNTNNTGPDLKIGEIDFERPKDKAIFGYWWNAIKTGMQETIK